MRSAHLTSKIKEALHQIKKELNYSETFQSQSSSETSRISKQSQQISRVSLALTAETLAANVSSHSSLRSKRRTHKSPQVMKIYSPLKKVSSCSYFSSPIPSVSNKASAFKVKPSITYFPTILATPSIESFAEIPGFNTKSFPEKKLDLEFVFSYSRIKSISLKKSLSSEMIIAPSRTK